MSGNSAEQPQKQAQEHAQKKREEKDRMMDLLKERVDEWNAKRGDLPEVVVRGSSIQMDRYILFLDFDQLPSLTDYVLVLRVGEERKPIFWPEPQLSDTDCSPYYPMIAGTSSGYISWAPSPPPRSLNLRSICSLAIIPGTNRISEMSIFPVSDHAASSPENCAAPPDALITNVT